MNLTHSYLIRKVFRCFTFDPIIGEKKIFVGERVRIDKNLLVFDMMTDLPLCNKCGEVMELTKTNPTEKDYECSCGAKLSM